MIFFKISGGIRILKNLDLEISYDTDNDDIINDFFVPVLSNSIKYERIVGYFNSGSLSTLTNGIKQFILNNGKMKVVCGYQLKPEDIKVIVESSKNIEDFISEKFISELDNLKDTEQFNKLKILGFMIKNNLLEIKILIKKDNESNPTNGILHSKIGIFTDNNGNKISFNGSLNETYQALNENSEHINVFNNWNEYSNLYLKDHQNYFDQYWSGYNSKYDLMSIPYAVKNKFIEIAPNDFESLIFESNTKKNKQNNKIKLFDYQLEARKEWYNNDKKGIFAMATGTGKTFTSLGCLDQLLKEENKLITIISVPYQHLVTQWKKSIDSFGLNDKLDKIIIADSSNHKRKREIEESLYEIDLDYLNKILIITTHTSLSTKDFLKFMNMNIDSKFLLIADEMHGLGSKKYKNGLLSKYDYRLGLSATPERVFDEEGTDFLEEYFDKTVYEFPLKKALTEINEVTGKTFLTPFIYEPYFVNIDTEKLEKYAKITKKINKIKHSKNINPDNLNGLYRERSNIIKNAPEKYEALKTILNDLGEEINNLIIYCSPQQIDEVVNIIGHEYKLSTHKFTMNEKTKIEKKYGDRSEREYILDLFSKQQYQCLIAIKCLDEGVDVPSASKAILMCNGTNPREFIQRLGRILRRSEKKELAEIYDIVIKPKQVYNNNLHEYEDYIYNKELDRCEEIAKLAKNNVYALKKLHNW